MNNRIGRFSISNELIYSHIDDVKRIFDWLDCVVVRAEMVYWGGVVEYTAISDRFDEVSEAETAPLYVFELCKKDDGAINVVGLVKV
jgi:hypothetical protein